jgi:diguanylate cyclase (GGDEF)-like protein
MAPDGSTVDAPPDGSPNMADGDARTCRSVATDHAHVDPDQRQAARLHAYELIHALQAGSPDAAAELEALTAQAEATGWSQVALIGLFGRAVAAWLSGDGTQRQYVQTLLERAEHDGDRVMVALALAMRSDRGFWGAGRPTETLTPADDADLAKAAVMLETAEGAALEVITARTACAIAFGNRWLWELADEQYATALALGAAEPPGSVDIVLAPILFNRVEEQVAWASTLRQLGDTAGVTARWHSWRAAAEASHSFPMPDAWRTELASLGTLLAAVAGEDVTAEAKAAMGRRDGDRSREPRAIGFLLLAAALSDYSAGRPVSAARAEEAVSAVDERASPHVYDLALYLAAAIESDAGHGAGLRYATRQITERWAGRLTTLGAVQSRIESERRSAEHDTLSRHAHLDDLTGIGNRRALKRHLDYLAARPVTSVALFMADVDRFKVVNDRHGHPVGDRVLRRIARVLADSIRSPDLVVRLGGDEFAVVLGDIEFDAARRRAEQLMAQLDAVPWADVCPGMVVTTSLGVAVGPLELMTELTTLADAALYEGKAAGGHAVVCRRTG